MENIGYSNSNCLTNLGTMYFLLAVYVIDVVYTILLAGFSKCSGKGKKALENKIKQLFFGELLVMSIESFIELYISGYLQLSMPFDTTVGERQGARLGYVLIFLALIFVPSALIWTFIQDRETLEEESFSDMWGPCYADISLRDNWSRAYHLVYITRRFIFISIGLFVKQPIFQIIGLLCVNYAMTFYYVISRP